MGYGDRYNSLIAHYWDFAGAKYGFRDDDSVDWRLVHRQIAKESKFDPKATGPTSDKGLLQLSPQLLANLPIDPFNPEENLRVGINHLGWLWNLFNKERGLERWKFALGAYNAGQGNIIRAQAIAESRGLAPDQWDSITQVLQEVTGTRNAGITTDYVKTIVDEYLYFKAEEEGKDVSQ